MLNTSTLQHLLLLYSLFYDDVDVDDVDVDNVDDNVDDDVQDASCTVKITSPKSAFYRAINRCSLTTNDFNTPFFLHTGTSYKQ